MSTVTYHKQPGIHKTRGAVPVEGTKHPYTVGAVLWPKDVEAWIEERLIGHTLHVCCGKSKLGHVRVDLYEQDVDVVADAARLPFADQSFDTVLIDPPYNGKFQWNHDMLNELHRLARQRIIFQHWFSPVDKNGQFKKAHVFRLTDAVILPVAPNLSGLCGFAVEVDGQWYITRTDEGSDPFLLQELAHWQPRTYFGRVQLISILDKVLQ